MQRFDAIWEAAQQANRLSWLAFGTWFEFSQQSRDQFMEQLQQTNNALIRLNQVTAEKLLRYGRKYDEYLLSEDHAEELVLHQECCAQQLEAGFPLTPDVHENVGPMVHVDGDWLKISEIYGFVMDDLFGVLSPQELDFFCLAASVDWLVHPLSGQRKDLQFHSGGSQGGYFAVEPDEVLDWEAEECEARFAELFPEREPPSSLTDVFGIALRGCRRDDREYHQRVSRFNQDMALKSRNLSRTPPRWDPELLELSFGGSVVSCWRGRAKGGSQLAVLDELETLGWPRRMPCPFSLGANRRRADDVVYRLNEKLRQQDGCPLVFHVADKDERRDSANITWEARRPVRPR